MKSGDVVIKSLNELAGNRRIGILEFYDENDLKVAMLYKELSLALWDIDNYMRGVIRGKTHIGKFKDNEIDAINMVREELYNILNGYGITLDDIIR